MTEVDVDEPGMPVQRVLTKLYLHLGSGAFPRFVNKGKDHTLHLDISPEAPHVELVCDLNHGIPLPNNTVSGIIAANILEHLNDIIFIMNEMHRVLIGEGTAWIQVPLFGTMNHITDPTHKHGFSMQSFDFFDDDTKLGESNGKLYTDRRWKIVKKEEVDQDLLLEMRVIKIENMRKEWPKWE